MGVYSKNTMVKSPVSKYIEWKSSKQAFQYYDGVKKEKVDIKLPVSFIALDDFVGVSGGEMDDAGKFHPVTSGIVAHLNKKLVVKKDDQAFATGTWAEVKEKVKSQGGRYTAYTYAIYKDELVCFKFAGASLSAWFSKGEGDAITVKESNEVKKGAIQYYEPVFETKPLTAKQLETLKVSDEAKKFEEYSKAKHAQKFDEDSSSEDEPVKPAAPKPDLSEEDMNDIF